MRLEHVRLTEVLAAARQEIWRAYAIVAAVESRTRLTEAERKRAQHLGERLGALLEEITR